MVDFIIPGVQNIGILALCALVHLLIRRVKQLPVVLVENPGGARAGRVVIDCDAESVEVLWAVDARAAPILFQHSLAAHWLQSSRAPSFVRFEIGGIGAIPESPASL